MSENSHDPSSWTCPNGHSGNTWKFCTECGAPKPEAPIVNSNPTATPVAAPVTTNPAPVAPTTAAPTAAPATATPVAAPVTATPAPVAAPVAATPTPVVNTTSPKKDEETPEDKKAANTLCAISLALMFGLPMLLAIIIGVVEGIFGNDSQIYESTISALATIGGLGPLSAFVLMIITRVKYPKNTFGKVLMWIYIAELVVSVILVIVLVIACVTLCQSCQGM